MNLLRRNYLLFKSSKSSSSSSSSSFLSIITNRRITTIPLSSPISPPLSSSSCFKLSVAPMMSYTHKYNRYLLRNIIKNIILYTEMIPSSKIIKNKDNYNNLSLYLDSNFQFENPLVLQLGGSNSIEVGDSAKIAYNFGYKQFNLNVGCPSERVSGDGAFGAVLMKTPDIVSNVCKSISNKTGIIPSVKCRIGIDDHGIGLGNLKYDKKINNSNKTIDDIDSNDNDVNNDEYKYLSEFIYQVHTNGGVTDFIIHARKAILNSSFSPSDNRKIPPLKYHYVYQLIKDFPNLHFVLNGGVKTFEEIITHRQNGVNEVMIGRGILEDPFYYRYFDFIHDKPNITDFNQFTSSLTRRQVLLNYYDYIQQQENDQLCSKSLLLAPVHNLFHGLPNGKTFRRLISEGIQKEIQPSEVLLRAMEVISDDILDQTK